MPRLVIFLDDGGVMNDNRLRGRQWQRLVAEFFVPQLGGTRAAWSAANEQVITRMLDPDRWQARLRASPDYASFDRHYQIDWLRWMCALVGVPTPADEDCVALGHAATRYITPRVRAAFPEVVAAIRTLHQQGYVLHTASGESSEDLDGYLQGMEVRACFGRLYGPDLLDTFKDGPRFYARMFADAGVAPWNALVVDDNPCTGYFAYPRSLDLKINRAWSQRPTQAMTRAACIVFVDHIHCVLSASTPVLYDCHHLAAWYRAC